MDTDSWKNDSSANSSIGDLLTENNVTIATSTDMTGISHRLLAAMYWMIFVVGVTGNLLVVAVVIWKLAKSPHHQAMTIFVGSLAVSDLGLLLWVTWICALLCINPVWMFSKLTCQMYILWRSLTADCSVTILMLISVDRYVTLSHLYYYLLVVSVWVNRTW